MQGSATVVGVGLHMQVLDEYANDLERFVFELAQSDGRQDYSNQISAALDGQTSTILRNSLSITVLRDTGVFFTNLKLASDLLTLVEGQIDNDTFLDPTCGVGDLLLARARTLPIEKDLETTLLHWGAKLQGWDLYPQFTKIARARLALLAIQRGASIRPLRMPLEDLFPKIHTCNGLTYAEPISASCMLINPPYGSILAPLDCTWARGKVSRAALFMDKYIKDAPIGTKIIAILPDVLRTGSRYRKWRRSIEQHTRIETVKIVGRFDKATDVDVFLLHLTKCGQTTEHDCLWWAECNTGTVPGAQLADDFEIHVGSVVPHRDPEDGPNLAYVHARGLPHWQTVKRITLRRRCSSIGFTPPFVVVRRTSSPRDKYRVVGTIIAGKRIVAVENHLIVLQPKSGSLTKCTELLENLRDPRTNDWINERIRCRHLTISALRELPWWNHES